MDEKYLPLLAMSAGLLGQGQQGQRPNFASSLGQGLLGGLQGMQMMQQVGDDKRQRRLQELQLSLASVRAQKEAAQEAARQTYMAQYGGTLSPEQKAAFNIAPEKFLDAKLEQQFATPKPPTSRTINDGGTEITQEWTPDGGWQEISRGSRWAPQQPTQGPETWSILSPDQVKAQNLPTGTYQVSNRGQIKPLDGTGGGAKETWALIPAEEIKTMGFAPGTVASRSSLGNVQVEQQPKGGGIQIFDPQNPGKLLASIGGDGATQQGTMGLTTPNASEIQKTLIAGREQAARLNQIKAGFKPEYQQIPTRAGNALTAGQEKLGMPVTPEAQADLGNFTAYRAEAVNNLNQIMKEQSGSAVTGNEFERNTAALPSSGTGIMDGDSPTEFQAKLNAASARVKNANARMAYLLSRGIPFDFAAGNNGGVEIDAMPGIIDAEGEEIEQSLISQGVSPEQAQAQAAAQLQAKYGL